MQGALDSRSALYLQIASMLEDQILRGLLLAEEQAPSTNELARTLCINPATAAKGLNLLVEEGALYKKRGVGMFVSPDGRERVLEKRRERFYEEYVKTLVTEARALGVGRAALVELIERAEKEKGEDAS